jgi:hypothetical protein
MQAQRYLVLVASLFAIAAGSAFGQDEGKKDDHRKEIRDRIRSRVTERFDQDKNGKIDEGEKKAAKEKMKELPRRRRDAAGPGGDRSDRGEGRRARRGMHPGERAMRMRRIERFREMRPEQSDFRRERINRMREHDERSRDFSPRRRPADRFRRGDGRDQARPHPVIERRIEERLERRDQKDAPRGGEMRHRPIEGRPMIGERRLEGRPMRPMMRARIIDRIEDRHEDR